MRRSRRPLPVNAVACGTAIVAVVLGATASAQSTTRVSLQSNGSQAVGHSQSPSISATGRFVAFHSWSSSLVAGDTNGAPDIFVHDRQTGPYGANERVSLTSSGVQANGYSQASSISADGRFVAFESVASNLVGGDTNTVGDVFVHDRQTGTTELVSVDSGGVQGIWDSYKPSISADGRFVAFESGSPNLVSGDTNGVSDIFVHDRLLGTTERVSVDSAGVEGNNPSRWSSISADGRYVAFGSSASNLVPGDTNATEDIFVHDRILGTTERASVDSSGGEVYAPSRSPMLSGDGRFVAFSSDAGFGASTTGEQVFVRNLQAGTIECASIDSGGAGANFSSHLPSISGDGRFVAFSSAATNLVSGDSNARWDIFVHDRQTGATERASIDSAGIEGNDQSWGPPTISADGSCVAFDSWASNLVAGDTNSTIDVFAHDRFCTGGPYTYCTAKTNSLGCIPSIGSIGQPTQSGTDNFYVTASNVLNNKLGMMLWSLGPASNPFFGGTLCVAQPIVRTPAQMSGGSPTGNDCTGTYAYHFSQAYMMQHLLSAHTTVYAQYWSRDPGFPTPNTIGLTNGLSFTICQ